MTSNGDILPLDKIGEICKRKGARVVVDGAHAPGAMTLDFRECQNIDFYGGNLHKWMMGPSGTGFGWINPNSKDIIQPLTAGWRHMKMHFILMPLEEKVPQRNSISRELLIFLIL